MDEQLRMMGRNDGLNEIRVRVNRNIIGEVNVFVYIEGWGVVNGLQR